MNQELKNRIAFIKKTIDDAKAKGIIFANSGGKDSALVGILCKMAVENTVSLIMPCGVERSYNQDKNDALELAEKYNISTRVIDLAETQNAFLKAENFSISPEAVQNIAPRLRMTAMYAMAQTEGRLVAGTGNASEYYMGYFTKWGDGAYDFNPIGDLTCTEVVDFLRFLKAPESIINKAPSAGLYEGQTDEAEMGITYENLDKYIKTGEATPRDLEIIQKYHARSGHKRRLPLVYG